MLALELSQLGLALDEDDIRDGFAHLAASFQAASNTPSSVSPPPMKTASGRLVPDKSLREPPP